jgi:hypothetical protein
MVSMTPGHDSEPTTQESPTSFLAMIDAEDRTDPDRQAQAAQTLAEHRASRARRDPAVTAALRARFGVAVRADAA